MRFCEHTHTHTHIMCKWDSVMCQWDSVNVPSRSQELWVLVLSYFKYWYYHISNIGIIIFQIRRIMVSTAYYDCLMIQNSEFIMKRIHCVWGKCFIVCGGSDSQSKFCESPSSLTGILCIVLFYFDCYSWLIVNLYFIIYDEPFSLCVEELLFVNVPLCSHGFFCLYYYIFIATHDWLIIQNS